MHVFSGTGQVLVELRPDGGVNLLETQGQLTRRNVRAALAAASEYHHWLNAEWERIHGEK